MRGRYGPYNQIPIGDNLVRIAGGQKQSGFVIIPESSYISWKNHIEFTGETKESAICEDGVEREFLTMNFVSQGHRWAVIVTKCLHPSSMVKGHWLFIDSIFKDDKEYSTSKTTIEEYSTLIKRNRG